MQLMRRHAIEHKYVQCFYNPQITLFGGCVTSWKNAEGREGACAWEGAKIRSLPWEGPYFLAACEWQNTC